MLELETIDDDAEKFNIEFVKINNKRLAKAHGINDFPTLTFFKDGQIQIFTGENNAIKALEAKIMTFIPILCFYFAPWGLK